MHRVVMLAYPGVEVVDLTGPAQVFSAAARLAPARARYRVELRAATRGPVPTPSGLSLMATSWRGVRGPIDTLLVPGCLDVHADAARRVVPTLQRLAPRAARVVGVCTGALLLADAGLLGGRRAVTHWAAIEELQRRAPGCSVESAPIYVQDGDVWTSAGVTAGMDLALALIEADHDADLARQVARWLVMYLRRPGGQTQFSPPPATTTAPATGSIAAVVRWVGDHLDDDLSVESLARRAAMSPRNFARVFRRQIGRPPAAWVANARLEAARSMLERSTASIAEIAGATGQSPETLHRVFVRALGTTPRQYRRRFTSG